MTSSGPIPDYSRPKVEKWGRRNVLLIGLGVLTAFFPGTCLYLSVNMLFIVPVIVGIACVIAGSFRVESETRRRVLGIGGALACVLASAGPLVLTAWANREGKPILIIIPAGYRGEIAIVKDRAKGEALVQRGGEWVYTIPPGGTLRVKDISPFFMNHAERYEYSDGTSAILADEVTQAGTIVTGPGSSKSSTEDDGSTLRWKTEEPRK